MNGITYYRLKSDYSGDFTKNCALNGTEVDNNFHVLEGNDVKSIAADGTDIIVTLKNGDVVKGHGTLDFVKHSEFNKSVVNVEFDKLHGILKLTTANGNVQTIEGFATNENKNLSVATDNTLYGSGLRNAPLGISSTAKTGQYKTVKAIINVADGNELPTEGLSYGDRYITCEDVSDYGYLYDYHSVHKIACELKKSGWRIPTKEDWDGLLNAIEPRDCDKNHNKSDKNIYLGKWSGKLLKSKDLWVGCGKDDHHHDCDHDHHHDWEHGHHHDWEHDHHHDWEHDHHDWEHGHHHDWEHGHHHDWEHDHHHDWDVCECFEHNDKCGTPKECEKECKSKKDENSKGLDVYKFRVTPTGYTDDGFNYAYFKERSAFWTATTDSHQKKAYIKRFQFDRDNVYQDVVPANFHLSLRLVKDYDGKNFHEVEEIMDMEYPTLLLPSTTKGSMIWTASNFASSNVSLNPVLPNNGQHLTYTRHFYINEWDGFKWVRNEIKQGESVTVEKAPKGKELVEYRVVGDKLISVNDMIFKEVMHDIKHSIKDIDKMIFDDVIHDVKHIINAVDKKLEGSIALVEKSLDTEREERKEGDELLQKSIDAEATRAQDIENQLLDAINNEVKSREEVENRVTNTETRLDEAEGRITNSETRLENVEGRVANTETRIENVEGRVTNTETRLENTETRIENVEGRVTNTETRLENTETRIDNAEEHISDSKTHISNAEIRLENVEGRVTNTEIRLENVEGCVTNTENAIIKEINDRKAEDERVEGKILSKEGTEFNPTEGTLTLKSVAGTNDITVQFSFNFGTF